MNVPRAAASLALAFAVLAAWPKARAQERPAPPGESVAPVGSGESAAPVGTSAPASPAPVSGLERLLLGHQLRGSAPGTRDPFATTGSMRDRAADASGSPRFVASSGSGLPRLSLRGYAEPRGKAPVALIEVEGQGVYVVRSGDTVGLTVGGKSSILKVVALEASSARVEAGSLGQVIVVR